MKQEKNKEDCGEMVIKKGHKKKKKKKKKMKKKKKKKYWFQNEIRIIFGTMACQNDKWTLVLKRKRNTREKRVDREGERERERDRETGFRGKNGPLIRYPNASITLLRMQHLRGDESHKNTTKT